MNSLEWEVVLLEEPIEKYAYLIGIFFDISYPNRFDVEKAGEVIFGKLFNESKKRNSNKSVVALALSEDHIVGIMTARHNEIEFEGKRLSCYEMGNTFTHPDFRKQGFCKVRVGNDYLDKSIFGRLFYEIERKYFDKVDFVYGLPNQEALSAWTKHAGFVEMKDSSLRSYVNYPRLFPCENLTRRIASQRNRLKKLSISQLTNKLSSEHCRFNLKNDELIEISNRFDFVEGLGYECFQIEIKRSKLFVIGKTKFIKNRSVFYICRVFSNPPIKYSRNIRKALNALPDFDRIVFLGSFGVIESMFRMRKFIRSNKVLIVVKEKRPERHIHFSSFFNSLSYGDTDIV